MVWPHPGAAASDINPLASNGAHALRRARERDFRLVFTSTTISAVGDGVAAITVVFAVLQIAHDSPTAVGVVLASRQAAAVVTLAAGVISDRLRRHVVLVAIPSDQAGAQAAVAALLLSGRDRRAPRRPRRRLRSRRRVRDPGVAGPDPPWGQPAAAAAGKRAPRAQPVDPRLRRARARRTARRGRHPGRGDRDRRSQLRERRALLLRLRVPPGADGVAQEPFLRKFREGWHEFRRQDWIWTTIVFFGIGNLANHSFGVLGPLLVEQHYGGAAVYGSLLSFVRVGSVPGGLVALRWRPRRPLLVSCVASAPIPVGYILLAPYAPLPVAFALQTLGGIGLALQLALWFTVFQREVPERARARASSYDGLGSFVLVPVGTAVAGPIGVALGFRTTRVCAAPTMLATKAAIVSRRGVWAIRDRSAPVAA